MPERALIGWRTSSPQASLAFLPPVLMGPEGGALAGRVIVARAAFDLRVALSPPGVRPVRIGLHEVPGGISRQAASVLVSPITHSALREPDRPAVQISLNLVLVTDAPCTLNLTPPFLWEGFRDWPGSLVSGRFPLTAWPRSLNAVLEWADRDRAWEIRRGDPLAYLWPEFERPDIRPELVEAATTPALERQLRMVDGVADRGRNVGPMMAEAARRRPARLLVPKRTGAPAWD